MNDALRIVKHQVLQSPSFQALQDHSFKGILRMDHSLFALHQREDRPKYALIPMGDHRFMLEGLDYFRIQFVVDEGGEFNEMIGQYDNGRTDGNKREK